MKDFRIEISSYLDFEGMVVDTTYLDNLIAKINCDHGIGKTEIFIYDQNKEEPIWKLDFSSFQNILLVLQQA